MSIKTSLNNQFLLFENAGKIPSTRFQGSKLKISNWIWDNIKDLEFETALDAFGGTGSIGYLLKMKGKQVAYNDILKFNWLIGTALIENDNVTLSEDDVDFLISKHDDIRYSDFIYKTFKDIYFTDEENKWLDVVLTNISDLDCFYKKALAYFALIQSCIIKRPYNLFHRKNLYIRFSDVKRSFGNKTTWDKPFEVHFKKFVKEINSAVFSNDRHNVALNTDAMNAEGDYDLVYIDTPYISKKGTGVNYLEFYHFLEGLVDYTNWPEKIDHSTINKRFKKNSCIWNDKDKILTSFDDLFNKFKDSILVVSYRSDGIPKISEIENLLQKYKHEVIEIKKMNYKYVLSNKKSEEVLLVGK